MPKNGMQHAYNPQNDIDTGQSIKCTAFARKTWPKKIGVSGFSYMVRSYPVKAVKTGNWCLTVCQGVQTLSTDIFDLVNAVHGHNTGSNSLSSSFFYIIVVAQSINCTITGVNSNQDQILLVIIREYIGFYVDRRS